MLAIKLQRVGRKHQPSYRIVVAEKRSKMASPPVEQLGFYDPSTLKTKSADAERVKHWIGAGAKPTPTVHNMLVGMGFLPGPKIAIKIKKKPQAEVVPAASQPAQAAEAGATPETPKAAPEVPQEAEPAQEAATETVEQSKQE